MGEGNLHKHPLTTQQHIGILLPRSPLVLHSDPPLPPIIHPPSLLHLVVQLDVSIEVPFPSDAMHVFVDFFAASVKSGPVRVGVEGEGLGWSVDGMLGGMV